ncbi:hypothetical protein AYX15_05301 [Cryptococcus neoformans]|nr:hypothetical protein AYX15_05301 [Cryptococcus neoformans var. grubii]
MLFQLKSGMEAWEWRNVRRQHSALRLSLFNPKLQSSHLLERAAIRPPGTLKEDENLLNQYCPPQRISLSTLKLNASVLHPFGDESDQQICAMMVSRGQIRLLLGSVSVLELGIQLYEGWRYWRSLQGELLLQKRNKKRRVWRRKRPKRLRRKMRCQRRLEDPSMLVLIVPRRSQGLAP